MFPRETDWLAQQAHHQELLLVAERARLARQVTAGPNPPERFWRRLAQRIAAWLRATAPRPVCCRPQTQACCLTPGVG
jgi:hypothetical protein